MDPLIFPINGITPRIHSSAFIAPGAIVCGDVEIQEDASVWYGCVLRGDVGSIVVGKGSNIQDGTVIHTNSDDMNGVPSLIGANVLVGHKCMLHGCTVEDEGFVGMSSTMLDGSRIESGGMLAAGAFLTAGKVIPRGELWGGSPAKKLRDMRESEYILATSGAKFYRHNANTHKQALQEFGENNG
ncbi:MAG: gamma carbonic anhydrase family protein [Pseudomonadota bacterium]